MDWDLCFLTVINPLLSIIFGIIFGITVLGNLCLRRFRMLAFIPARSLFGTPLWEPSGETSFGTLWVSILAASFGILWESLLGHPCGNPAPFWDTPVGTLWGNLFGNPLGIPFGYLFWNPLGIPFGTPLWECLFGMPFWESFWDARLGFGPNPPKPRKPAMPPKKRPAAIPALKKRPAAAKLGFQGLKKDRNPFKKALKQCGNRL